MAPRARGRRSFGTTRRSRTDRSLSPNVASVVLVAVSRPRRRTRWSRSPHRCARTRAGARRSSPPSRRETSLAAATRAPVRPPGATDRDGIDARVASVHVAHTGVDLSRLATEHDVDLLLVDAPDGLLEDARVLTLLEQAPCDVGVVVDGTVGVGAGARPVRRRRARLGGRRAGRLARAEHRRDASAGRVRRPATDGRDASRLLANASIAVQRALGVPAEPGSPTPIPTRSSRPRRTPGSSSSGSPIAGGTRARTCAHRAGDARRGADDPRPPRDAPRWSRAARERDALHLDDRRLISAPTAAASRAHTRDRRRTAALSSAVKMPSKVCSTPSIVRTGSSTTRPSASRAARSR